MKARPLMLAVLLAAVLLGAIVVAIYSIVAPIRVARAGDLIVVENDGPPIRGARLSVTIGGKPLEVARDLPGGRTEIPLVEFGALGQVSGQGPGAGVGAGFEGATVRGSRWMARGWTWHIAGPVKTATAEEKPAPMPDR